MLQCFFTSAEIEGSYPVSFSRTEGGFRSLFYRIMVCCAYIVFLRENTDQLGKARIRHPIRTQCGSFRVGRVIKSGHKELVRPISFCRDCSPQRRGIHIIF